MGKMKLTASARSIGENYGTSTSKSVGPARVTPCPGYRVSSPSRPSLLGCEALSERIVHIDDVSGTPGLLLASRCDDLLEPFLRRITDHRGEGLVRSSIKRAREGSNSGSRFSVFSMPSKYGPDSRTHCHSAASELTTPRSRGPSITAYSRNRRAMNVPFGKPHISYGGKSISDFQKRYRQRN
jgi:hypothetical protein